MLNFRDCTLANLDKTFNLRQTRTRSILDDWLNREAEISEFEQKVLLMLQENAKLHIHDWNEAELSQHLIGPLFALVNFSSQRFALFAERSFGGTIEGIEMSGRPDGIIASGFREPEKPYFCFQEYKKEKDPDGDPAGQALAAMLVAQEINEHQQPIYGCYVIGRTWFFMTLKERDYEISDGHIITRDDIFDVFRVLKVLKQMITQFITGDNNGDRTK
ncbi:hypothetical protein QUF64_12880 [Anaerolineales bacterium HSG6]|nr:hypothetical protein [Anaerolineales bacterium HSG6]